MALRRKKRDQPPDFVEMLGQEEWVVAFLWLPWARGINGASDEFSAAALELSRGGRGFRDTVKFAKVDAQTEIDETFLKVCVCVILSCSIVVCLFVFFLSSLPRVASRTPRGQHL